MDYTEIFGAATGLLYVLLEIKQRKLMWIVGGLSALVYTVIFFKSSLYAAMLIQVYFIFASIYGWIIWNKSSGNNGEEQQVRRPLSILKIVISIILTGIIFLTIRYMLSTWSFDPMPDTDALVASLSILATYWVSHKYIYHWIIWIIANVIAIYMYSSQGLYVTAVLYFVYTIAAVAGFLEWRKFSKVLN